ncbi:PREDICTED: growth-regulating factor 5-like isoform X2 [Lupinus angustifolius]|uniref:growth-regulating factor 5-like isoform X2 n=1 Tax=Lupinus angustifolius TaxID=3871 RepID=UPI00092E9251|nr:PREDICTED: growth-regulating factor 5-like isoform X2 [Lupinus angustifolius]
MHLNLIFLLNFVHLFMDFGKDVRHKGSNKGSCREKNRCIRGTPIPPDLIYSIKRSLDSSITSRLFPHQPIGWGCFEMGFGRKVDPEPGRCRRTDGKKWRCSKEAYPDSKYCERHMHRGRNRSRKPVEVSSATSTASTTTNTTPPIPSYNRNNLSMTNPNNINSMISASPFPFSPLPSSIITSESQPFSQSYQSSSLNPFFYSQSTSSRATDSESDFLSPDATTHQLFMDSGSYSHNEKDYRHIHGMREGVDERAFFPEASGSARTYPDSYQQLSMSSYKPYSNSHFQNMNENTSKQEQHCFVLGTDFKSDRLSKEKETETTTSQKPLHHFFGEWTPKNTDSWLDLASNSRIQTDD